MSEVSAQVAYKEEFEAKDKQEEFIIRYSGDISYIESETNIKITILSQSFAIAKMSIEDIALLKNYSEVEYIDTPKRLYFADEKAQRAACVTEISRGGLTGRGVLVGVIDSGISNIVTEFGDRLIGVYDAVDEKTYTYEKILSGNFKGNDFKNHGTAVASIAAGSSGVAYGAWLAAVKIDDSRGYASSVQIMKGLKYISDLAINMNVPAAINLSYGTNDGAHTGKSLFEQYIAEISVLKKINIVASVGNEGNKSGHYRADVGKTVEFRLDDDVKSVSFSIWKEPSENISLEMISPSGNTTGFVDYRQKSFERKFGNTTVRGVFGEVSPYSGESEIYISMESTEGFLEGGIWKIKFFGNGYENVDIWLPILSSVSFLSPSTDTTITIPSTSTAVLSVAAFDGSNNADAPFSGRGYAVGGGVKPDISAPGVNISAISSSGNIDYFTGTSFAAPMATGCVALLLEWGIVRGNDDNLFGERLKYYIMQGAERDEGKIYPNRINGYGRLCFKNTINLLRNINVAEVKENAVNEEYADVIFDYSNTLENIFTENNVQFCRVCTSYILAFIPKKVYDIIISDESFGSGARAGTPLLLAPMATDGEFENALNEGALLENALDESGILRVQNTLGLRGNGVLVGIIDDGIDILNDEFIYEDNTSKVISLWNQGAEGEELCYGREYNSEEINEAVKNGVNIAPSTDGHGTKLAIAAAGKNGAAPNSDIIFVKLKQAKNYLKERLFITGKSAYQDSDIMTAADFIVNKAYELGRSVSILIGMGTNEGGHSGYTLFEKCLSSVAVKNGISLCVPMGNEAVARHHCGFEVSDSYDIELNVGSKSAGCVIWIWNSLLERTSVSVISPIDERVERIQPSSSFSRTYKLVLTGSEVEINYSLPLYKTSQQLTQIRITNITSGVWKIRVFADTDNLTEVLAWLPVSPFISEDIYFLNPDVKTTLTVPASTTDILTVGGYNSVTGGNYAKSGRGPTANGFLRPDIVAPVGNFGTSYASAITAGAAALLLEWGIVRKNNLNMNTTTISAYLSGGAVKQDGTTYPNNAEGYGRLNLYNTFRNL